MDIVSVSYRLSTEKFNKMRFVSSEKGNKEVVLAGFLFVNDKHH